MKVVRILIAVCIIAAVIPISAVPVLAADGMPGSPNFAIGISLENNAIDEIQSLSATYGVSWIKLSLDWNQLKPTASVKPDFSNYQKQLSQLKNDKLALLISLQNPPAWVVGENGPAPTQVIAMVDEVLTAFPQATALEFLPEANTFAGWGTTPNGKDYVSLLMEVQRHITQKKSHVLLVAGGLLSTDVMIKGSIPDTDFLQQMYSAGAAAVMPVISLHFSGVATAPWEKPASANTPTLRHYEEIRKIMIDNHHATGLIWITSLQARSTSIQGFVRSSSPIGSSWMLPAISQMQSQLYLGAVFLSNLESLMPEKKSYQSSLP